ncbi:MAG: DUF2971 domain-containing protein [Candidatus Sulfotelmatobacter sp.]
MRAYKFLSAQHGLKSIKEKRIKQSRVADLNDPFELRAYDVTDPILRQTFLQTRNDVDKDRGLLCFSASWKNPVIWAHYSDKHAGLCLGFDIPEMKVDPLDNAGPVEYVAQLLPCPTPGDFENMSEAERQAFARKALFTKFEHWVYEEEIREWGPPGEKDGELYFVPFSENLRLAEVIAGQRFKGPKSEIIDALGSLAVEVEIKKARASYNKFEMVEDEGWH